MKKLICFFFLCFIVYGLSAETLVVTNINDSGTGSLRRMVEIANNGDSIIFDNSLAGKTIESLSVIQTNNSLIINGGHNKSKITLSGRNQNAILSGNFRLYNLIFTESKGSAVSECLYANSCVFEKNYSTISGGAIVSSKILTILDCTFKDNIAEVSGGAISYSSNLYNSSLTPSIIKNCTFENNKSKNGGAVSSSIATLYNSSNGYMIVTDCTFKKNMAEENGGALYSSAFTNKLNTSSYNHLTVTNCMFTENISTKYGGAIFSTGTANPSSYTYSTFTTLQNSNFENNKVEGTGIVYSENLTSTDCIFRKNTGGGVIYSRASLISNSLITNCYFEENFGSTIRMRLFNKEGCIITHCTFVYNIAESGGAILCENVNTGNLSIMNSTFKGNTADKGGAIYFHGTWAGSVGNLSLVNCSFENNTATTGGAIYIDDYGKSSISKSTFSNNSSTDGGAIYNLNTASKLKGNIFVNNKLVVDNILYDVKNCASEGYNVYMSNQNTVFSQSTDYRYTGSQNLLVPIGDYGGNTPTMPINVDITNWKEIVVRVPLTAIPDIKTDQRGLLLPTSGMACAGAVEMNGFTPSDDATLSNITISSGTLTPTFSSNVYNYSADVGYNVNRITINGIPNNPNAIISGEVNNQWLSMGDNVITLIVTAQAGNTQKYVITVKKTDNPTSAPMVDKEAFKVYPNPTNDIIYFKLEKESVVQLYDLSGKLILSSKYQAGDVTLSFNQQPVGIYFLKIDNQMIKVVKQ